ncbi:CopD family protein, partial [Serratia marcescens]|uniref:CopD family protein n=2 Tax=Pseudomonadota TaxID=1224 RepID=UPI001953C371
MSSNEMPVQNSNKTASMARAIGVVFALVVVTLVYLYPDNAYLWVKALHVIAVISWMAGMLYLPRLFI